MRCAASKIRKHVLANGAIDVGTRLMASHSHVLSTGEYACGTWARMTGHEVSLHHRAVSDIYRMVNGSVRMEPEVAKQKGVSIKSDVKVFKSLGVMAPTHRIIFARVRILVQVLRKGRTDILTLLFEGLASKRS